MRGMCNSIPLFCLAYISWENSNRNKLEYFSNNRLTSEKECGIILVNKDKYAIFIISLMVYRIRRQTI